MANHLHLSQIEGRNILTSFVAVFEGALRVEVSETMLVSLVAEVGTLMAFRLRDVRSGLDGTESGKSSSTGAAAAFLPLAWRVRTICSCFLSC